MTAPYLVLAVGNESRGDDALGPLLLRQLEAWLETTPLAGRVELIEEFQLQVENTLDLQGRELVLFIDAGKGTQAPFSFRQAAAQRMIGHTTHAVAPEMLLGIYDQVHGEAPPPMFILCVAGESFELGEPLTPVAGAHREAAGAFACALFESPGLEAWRSLAEAHAGVIEADLAA